MRKFKKKIRNCRIFLIGLADVAIHISKVDGLFEVMLKAKLDFKEKRKKVLLHAEGSSKTAALKNALVKLTAKYGKLCKKYSIQKGPSQLKIAG